LQLTLSNPRDAGRGAQAGFRRACSPLPERIRACKREDREIPAASTIITLIKDNKIRFKTLIFKRF
jgi:hypothetical protein